MYGGKEILKIIHFDITYFCNYHCEYCYQGTEKIQKHISNTIYDNFFIFLAGLKERFNVHLIGGEPFLYPRFFEMVEGIVKLGHTVSLTTNFSLPENILEKFYNIAKDKISFVEISFHLSQIKDLDAFINKLLWFIDLVGDKRKFRLLCVLTSENFEKVKYLLSVIRKNNLKIDIQRQFDENGYVEYNKEMEDFVEKEKCIDVPLHLIKDEQKFDVVGKMCYTGKYFCKILIDGTVTRCFSKQWKGFDILGNLNKSPKVKMFDKAIPCLSCNKECRCIKGFNNMHMIDFNHSATKLEMLKYKLLSKIKLK